MNLGVSSVANRASTRTLDFVSGVCWGPNSSGTRLSFKPAFYSWHNQQQPAASLRNHAHASHRHRRLHLVQDPTNRNWDEMKLRRRSRGGADSSDITTSSFGPILHRPPAAQTPAEQASQATQANAPAPPTVLPPWQKSLTTAS
jgi:hypothetical protein